MFNRILKEPSSINESFCPGNWEEVQMIRKQRKNQPKWHRKIGEEKKLEACQLQVIRYD